MSEENSVDAVELATELTIAWLGNSNTRASADDVPAFLRSMHEAVTGLSGSSAPAAAEEEAAPVYEGKVTARKSLASPDHIISMIDGKPYKTLRRHIATHGMTDVEYRERYGLKRDYPMVAQTYSEARKAMALKIGLGSKGRQAKAEKVVEPVKATRKPRKAKASVATPEAS